MLLCADSARALVRDSHTPENIRVIGMRDAILRAPPRLPLQRRSFDSTWKKNVAGRAYARRAARGATRRARAGRDVQLFWHDVGGFNNSPFADIAVGTPFSGTYTFSLGAVDENSFPTVGDYWHRSAPYGVTVRIGNRVFRSDASAPEFLIEVSDNHSNSDNYVFISYRNQPTDGVDVGLIYWQLDDPTQSVLSSPALLATPPVLSEWQHFFG